MTELASSLGDNVTLSNVTLTVPPPDAVTIISVVCYALICGVGLLGNGLVVFVVGRYANMKTITNLYILNLSIADWLFLLGLPLIITTSTLKHWVFGETLCKFYYILTCINMFTSAFTLVAMSVDRYMAVCHPVTSIPYRTRTFALAAIGAIWVVSALVILPVVLYARTVPKPNGVTTAAITHSCVIQWPASHANAGKRIFVVYTLLVGFVLPVVIICALYAMLLSRLRHSRHAVLRRRSQRKVTRLVSLIIGVFVFCWLPYWAFQLFLIVRGRLDSWHVAMFQFFTILSYANSMMNPLLYAFTNENFRQAFTCAFRCSGDAQLSRRDSDCTSARHQHNGEQASGLLRAQITEVSASNKNLGLDKVASSSTTPTPTPPAAVSVAAAATGTEVVEETSKTVSIASPVLESEVFSLEHSDMSDIELHDSATQTEGGQANVKSEG